mmetsp:Transcript_5057/g.14006  ORF Transcript_5057/g.14006 Transcript_5057/m.14006 type:complete len:174 (-) Transcript_5057:137-658(-)
MVIPLSMSSAPSGPPSPFVLKMAKWFLAILIVQSISVIFRLWLLDIFQGFIIALCVGLGWYAWKENMNMRFIMFYGIMCLIQGLFDLVRFIDSAVHSPAPVFSSRASFEYNFASAIRILSPTFLIVGAVFAYYIYNFDTPTSEWSESTPFAGSSPARPATVTFSGGGQRLGTV